MYPWFVFLHVVGLLVFVAAHGVSGWVAFRVRGEADRRVVTALLGMSLQATRAAYLGLLALGIGGLGAAWSAGLLTAPWVVGSYIVVAVVLVVMYAVASPFYMGLRKALEAPPGGDGPIDDAELAARLQNRRPELLVTVGVAGLVILVWLMSVKPV